MNDPKKIRRIVDYIIVADIERERLCVLVRDFMKNGYMPQGGIDYSNFNSVKQYTQAMIKLG